MSSANLRGARFLRSFLEAVQLDGASVARADFSGSQGLPSEIDVTAACIGLGSVTMWCGPPQKTASAEDIRPRARDTQEKGVSPCGD